MAASNFAVSSPADLTDGEANDPDDAESNSEAIRTAFNASLETSTGHYHDGADSRSVSGGITGFTFTEAFLLMYGSFSKGGL